ncbi:MAG: hypothetical protein ACRDSP_05630 [Pseudonocardiaceae bacterium]
MTQLVVSPAVAWHEAGHAVAYVVHRVRFRTVTARCTLPGIAGMVGLDKLPADPRVRAVVAHCGPLAEARWQLLRHQGTGPTWDADRRRYEAAAYDTGGGADMDTVRGALQALHSAGDPYRDVGRDLIRLNWRPIERVAAALVERDLSHLEVVGLAGAVW